MRSIALITEDGWPYPDSGVEMVDFGADPADDVLPVAAMPEHFFDGLDSIERAVIEARFGLNGSPIRTMGELHDSMGVSRSALRHALGSGITKLRSQLA